MTMEAGKLRHRVAIERPTTTRNDAGERVATAHAIVATMWAEVRPKTAREQLRDGSLTREISHVVTMRYTPAVDPACRLRMGERVFNIAGVVNLDERGRELQILCHEVPQP